MNTRCVHLGIAVLVTVTAIVVLGTTVALAAPGQGTSIVDIVTVRESGELGVDIHARRAISIPFGIDSPLALSDDGRQVTVTGPGECREAGERFEIHVQVRQESTGAFAHGRNHGECQEATTEWTWSVEAYVSGQSGSTFEEGEAQVCALAIMHLPGEGAVTRQWCRDDVTLID